MNDLEAAIRRIVREEIAAVLRTHRSGEYSSEALPPLTSRRSFHEVCRSGGINGARKEGRHWWCPREEWHRARLEKLPTSRTAPSREKTLEELADEAILAAGFRRTVDPTKRKR